VCPSLWSATVTEPPPPSHPLLQATSAFLVRRRWAVLAVTLLVVGGLAWPAFQIRTGYSIASFLRTDDPELEAAAAHYGEGFDVPDNLLLFGYPDPDPTSPAGLERMAAFAARVAAEPAVERVLYAGGVPGADGDDTAQVVDSRLWRRLFVGRSGRSAGGVAVLDRDRGLVEAELALFERMRQAARDLGAEELWLAGVPFHNATRIAKLREDQAFFLPVATVLAALVLLWLVPLWRLAIQAVLVAPLTLLATVGTMSLCGVELTVLTSVLPTLLLAMAVADGVHLVQRFSEMRREGVSATESAQRAMERTFFPCLVTSVTTALGFLSLCVANMGDLVELGAFAAIGLLYAFVLTMVVMPATLSFVQQVPPRRRLDLPGRLVGATAGMLRRPRLVLAVAGALVAVAAWQFTNVEQGSRLADDIWPSDPVALSVTHYEAEFVPMMPGEVIVTATAADGFSDPAAWAELEEVVDRLEATRGMERTLSIVDPVRDGVPRALVLGSLSRLAAPELGALLGPEGRIARVLTFQEDLGTAWFEERRRIIADWNTDLEHTEVRAAGVSIVGSVLVNQLVEDLAQSFVGSLLIIFVLVWTVFRSVRLGWIAMVPSLFPLLLNLGVMGAMGISLRPITVITFCIAFGLAVDDTIHLLARYREERRAGLGRSPALAASLKTAGRPVVVTTLLLMVGFGTVLFSSFKGIFLFGLLVGLALLGSMIGALVMLPALLQVTKDFHHGAHADTR